MDHNNHLATEVAITRKDIDFLRDGFLRLEKSFEEHKKESKERIDDLWNKIVTIAVVGGMIGSGFWAFDLWLHPSQAQYQDSVEKRFSLLEQRVTTVEVTDNIKSTHKE